MKKKNFNFEFLLNNVSIILVINLMFFRGIWFSSINATGTGMSLILVQTVLVLLSIFKNRRIPVSILLNFDFIILAFINSLISSLFFLNNTSLSKILIELTIVGGLMFNFSYLIKKKKIKLSQLANVIVFIGSLLSIYILQESLNVGSVRRFASLPTSVNYLSHSLMISLYLNGYYLLKQKISTKKNKIYRLVFFFIQLSALFLLGSRSTLVSLVLISLYLLRYMSFNTSVA